MEDSALVDAIHEVQLRFAKAEVSLASAFIPSTVVRKGKITVRQLAALYPYDNTLYAMEIRGRELREALENSARYFQSDGTINRKFLGFNFDTAAGVEYEIDVREPEGRRVKNLRWRGRPLADDQILRAAINSYRAGGSGGYQMLRGAKIVWRSAEEVRELMIQHFREKGRLPKAPDDNWRVVPDAAREALKKEALGEAARPAVK